MTKLTRLYLSGNDFLSADIPLELTLLPDLEVLILSSNNFTGEIPQELARLTKLRALHLNGNELTGEIPPDIGAAESLGARAQLK